MKKHQDNKKNSRKKSPHGTSHKQQGAPRKERAKGQHKERPQHAPASTPRLKANLWGTHAVQKAWLNGERKDIRALYITEQALRDFDITAPIKRPPPTIIDKSVLDRALPKGVVHQGIALDCPPLENVDLKEFIIAASLQPQTILLMLDQVTDPHNIGAILRSACAFGAQGMIMQKKHAPDLGGVLAKTACGAIEHVPVAYETNLTRTLEELQDNGFHVIGLDERGEDIAVLDIPDKCVLVLGAEGPGLRRLVKEQCDTLARLPMNGPMPSINVSNAAAVALYAVSQK